MAAAPLGARLAAFACAALPLAAAQTAMPVIGVLSLPMDLPPPLANYSSYFVASYVKWLEAGGARVVPILYDAPAEATLALLAQLNGAVLTGGAAAFFEADGLTLTRYATTAQLVLNESLRAQQSGEWWPVWGTCLGHELLMVLAAGPDHSVLGDGFDSEDLQLALTPTVDAASSRLWGTVNEEQPDAWAYLTAENITENLHVKGVEPSSFAASSALSSGYRFMSTNLDRAGRPFVSSFESKTAPVYGVQFHPEKVRAPGSGRPTNKPSAAPLIPALLQSVSFARPARPHHNRTHAAGLRVDGLVQHPAQLPRRGRQHGPVALLCERGAQERARLRLARRPARRARRQLRALLHRVAGERAPQRL